MKKGAKIAAGIGIPIIIGGISLGVFHPSLERKLVREFVPKCVLEIYRDYKNRIKREERINELVDEISKIEEVECSKYARFSAELLGGVRYVPTHAWRMGELNRVVANIEEPFENYYSDLIPNKTIVLFHYDKSNYNSPDRIGTHLGLYVGDLWGEPVFLQQFKKFTGEMSISEMLANGLTPKQILAPKEK